MKKFLDMLIMLVLGTGCFLFTWIVAGGKMDTNMMYNLIFLGMVMLLYLIGVVIGFFRIHDLSIYFQHSGDVLSRMMAKDAKPYTDVPNRVKSIKGYMKIDKKLDEFMSDLGKTQSGICDVEDYINYDEIDKLVHKWYMDLVPDIMTSLGILGTFVGLVWGLRAFDTSGLDTMTASVTSLIDGIKVAFLTSIYGLVCSLVFQYTTNRGYANLLGYVSDFLDKFHMFVVPSASIDAQNKLVHSQRGQYEMMKSLGVELSESMSGGITQNLTPALQKLDSTLDSMFMSQSSGQENLNQDMMEYMRKIVDASDSNERLITLVSEVCNRMDETNTAVLETQRQLLDAIKALEKDRG